MSSSSSVHALHTPCSPAEMGAGQIETVAQKVSQMGARLDREGLDGARVHGERDRGHVGSLQRWRGAAPRHECAGRPASAIAGFRQDRVGYSRIELPGEVAGDTPAEKRRGVANNDRGCVQRRR